MQVKVARLFPRDIPLCVFMRATSFIFRQTLRALHQLANMSKKTAAMFNNQVKNLHEKLSKKRRGEQADASEKTYLSVQLVSQDPQGTFQKYRRIGVLESVEVNVTPTLVHIKDACTKHYGKYEELCDLLVSERGPSVKHISQLNVKKVIHVRFISEGEALNSEIFQRPVLLNRSSSTNHVPESTRKRNLSSVSPNESSLPVEKKTR